ncbi:uncharacterized protein LOC129323042 [Prosopis cineraria]|uniref:uncharacterized protein LOC129323042 n=1 Tax=Prosopis cineraria TaxID=364024 RepID=UPI0024103BA2|nr:uncharacterized protein LOC129323042 [Prosopis cineraria]
MLRATTFLPLCNSTNLLNATQSNSDYSLAFTIKAQSYLLSGLTLTDSSFMLCFKSLQFQHPCVNSNAAYGNGFGVCALKKRGKAAGVGVLQTDDFDEDVGDSDNDFGDFSGEEDDDEDDEGVVMPFEQMRKWLKNKPRGFGVGKVYDTSIEDKLLDEIRESREAQVAIEDNPMMSGVKKNEEKKAQDVKSGVQVRLVNLPKKKNIYRDLKLAFQEIPGLVDIVPAVSGNKRTRDPVCKGFAFVYFKCEEDAARFVQLYSGKTVTFGKVQKRIKCELLNEKSSVSAYLESSQDDSAAATPQLLVPAIEENPNEDSNVDNSAFSCWDETVSSTDDSDPLFGVEQVQENEEYAATLDVDDGDDSMELQIGSEINSLSLEQKPPGKPKQGNVVRKKPPSKEKVKKVPKFDVLRSAKRLKIKEKAVLSDVLSKYGPKSALASKGS